LLLRFNNDDEENGYAFEIDGNIQQINKTNNRKSTTRLSDEQILLVVITKKKSID
jgi:predicted 2-oxoglutarate/Fe(II)-dependent dioxygenase YbiX